MTQVINAFKDKYRFLSNFAKVNIRFEGYSYPSVEHAFQAAKTLVPEEREAIRLTRSAAMAKHLGRSVKLRRDWDKVKLEIMGALAREKFRDPIFRKKLLETGDAEIVEGNDWGDTFWGKCRGKGENHLGCIIMRIRDEIKREGHSAAR